MEKRDSVPGLAARLKAAREAAQLSQVQAGAIAGVHPISISQFETEVRTPTLATLYKLAEAYGVGVCEMLPSLGATPSAGEPAAKPAKRKAGKGK